MCVLKRKSKILKILSQNHISGGNFMWGIDGAHSWILKMLPWPWFREIKVCIKAKIELISLRFRASGFPSKLKIYCFIRFLTIACLVLKKSASEKLFKKLRYDENIFAHNFYLSKVFCSLLYILYKPPFFHLHVRTIEE